MRFAMVNKGLRPLNKIINQGYQYRPKAYMNAISSALRNAITGDYPAYQLDYSRIQVAEGKLQLPPGLAVTIDTQTLTAHLCWEPQLKYSSYPGRADDQVNIVCLYEGAPAEGLPAAYNLKNRAKRSDGKAFVDLERVFGSCIDNLNPGNIHFWVYLTSADLAENSDSEYV